MSLKAYFLTTYPAKQFWVPIKRSIQ